MTLTRLATLAALVLPSFQVLAEEILPAQFEHNRVFLSAAAPDGEEVVFYTDTGGGFNAVTESVAAGYSLAHGGTAESENGELDLVQFPDFAEKSGIPIPAPDRWLGGNLAVVPDKRLEADGFLGSRWFAGKIWVFDYPGEKLSRLSTLDLPADFEEMPLGFRADDAGIRDLNFPRVTIQIDGEPLDVLLDTGATALLTKSSASEYGLSPGTRVGTSYIVRSKYERWRTRHPDWKIVMDGEAVTGQAMPMIEVPEVKIGRISVGPVWFSVRPDETFLNWMSQMMDKQIVGAVGGSMLQYLRMIVDYPAAKAYFQFPADEGSSEQSGRVR
ncbi:hypothetical protein [Wenzhouxiangella sp. EGI_FJ10305]|uniref:hypothetical protein n=1 Tax=Wenzhouxiangella sp. EGI_FJ10305 TaxID=3243768 RepID=UPI0035DCF81D